MTRGTHQATRARVISAATELFSERGYSGTSVDAIAERAGMTTGALYSNFSGKGEVFRTALLLATGNPDDSEGSAAPEEMRPTDPASAHAQSGAQFLDQLSANPSSFRLVLWAVLEAQRDPDVAEILLRVLQERRATQIKFLRTTSRAEDDNWVAESATQLNALALGIGVQHLIDPEYVTRELAKRILYRTISELCKPVSPAPEALPLGLSGGGKSAD